MTDPTPDQHAETVRAVIKVLPENVTLDDENAALAALSELVNLLTQTQQQRDEAESLAQQIRNRAERAEAERDRLAAALEQVEALEPLLAAGRGRAGLRTAVKIAREALAQTRKQP